MSIQCLVTGANGHLGNNLVRQLLAADFSVRAGVRKLENNMPFQYLDCELVFTDLLDRSSLVNAMQDIDILFQVGAVFKHWASNPKSEIIDTNLVCTRNVIETAAGVGVKKIVYVSSIAALDHSSSPMDEASWNHDQSNAYYWSKAESERLAWDLADKLNLWMVTVLPSAIVGPNSFGHLTPTMTMLANILSNAMPIDPEFNSNYIDVNDIAQGMIQAALKGRSGERYLLANEQHTTSTELFDLAKTLYPNIRKPSKLPKPFLYLIAAATGAISKITRKEPPILRSWIHLFHRADLRCDISKARKD